MDDTESTDFRKIPIPVYAFFGAIFCSAFIVISVGCVKSRFFCLQFTCCYNIFERRDYSSRAWATAADFESRSATEEEQNTWYEGTERERSPPSVPLLDHPGGFSSTGINCYSSTSTRAASTQGRSPQNPRLVGESFVARAYGGTDSQLHQQCVICLDRPKDMVLEPCLHFCLCADCAAKIKKCPMCRAKIEAFAKFEPEKHPIP